MITQRDETLPHPALCVCVADDQVEGDDEHQPEEDGPLDDVTGL